MLPLRAFVDWKGISADVTCRPHRTARGDRSFHAARGVKTTPRYLLWDGAKVPGTSYWALLLFWGFWDVQQCTGVFTHGHLATVCRWFEWAKRKQQITWSRKLRVDSIETHLLMNQNSYRRFQVCAESIAATFRMPGSQLFFSLRLLENNNVLEELRPSRSQGRRAETKEVLSVGVRRSAKELKPIAKKYCLGKFLFVVFFKSQLGFLAPKNLNSRAAFARSQWKALWANNRAIGASPREPTGMRLSCTKRFFSSALRCLF